MARFWQVLVVLVFLFTISYFVVGSRTDSLLAELERTKHNTVKLNLFIKISNEYAQSDPSVALDWLNRALDLSYISHDTSTDSSLCYYRGKAHIEIARVYLTHRRHLDLAKFHVDSGVLILSKHREKELHQWHSSKTLNALAEGYNQQGRIHLNLGNLNDAIESYAKSANYFEAVGDMNGHARMNNNLGVLHRRQSNYAKSLDNFQRAMDYFESKGDSIAFASVLMNIGAVSFDIGALEKSLENYLVAMTIFEKHHNKEYLASTLINVGQIMGLLKGDPLSIPYYVRALNILKDIKDESGIATCYLSIGSSYMEMGKLDSSYHYLSKSKQLFNSIGDKLGEAESFLSLGELFFQRRDLSQAERYFIKAKNLATEIDLHSVLVKVAHGRALIELERKNHSLALELGISALSLARKHNLTSMQKEAHKVASEIYEKMGDFMSALKHHKDFYSLADSIISHERSHKFAEMEALYQLEQKKAEITRLERERALREFDLKNAELRFLRQRTQTFITLGVLLFLSLVLYLLYRQFRLKRYANKALKEQNAQILQKNEEITAQKEEIELQRNEMEHQKGLLKEKSEQLERFNWILTESIDYASSIQSAVLPSSDIFFDFFSDHFIMLYPKDVVSGDFYWAYPKDDSVIVALADCTGHGVPGGFMSMLAISALTELMGREVLEPAEILDNLRLVVIESLKQKGKVGEHQEGLDISIIRYSKGDDYIEFAGANHPIWIIREQDGNQNLIQYKGDRMPISFHRVMKPFASHRIPVMKGDRIYLFSDGFRHQLGGDSFSEKYGRDRFLKLILKNSQQPMDNQKSIVEDAFFRWVRGYDQIDDITVMGLKI